MAVPAWPESACCTASMARGRTGLMDSWSRGGLGGAWGRRGAERRRSGTRSQQARLRGLPQAHESIETVHQQVHLLRAGRRLGGGLELRADARHLLAPLSGSLGGDLVQDRDDALPRPPVLGDLPQVVRELFALAAQLTEGVEQGRRAARRVGIAHGSSIIL